MNEVVDTLRKIEQNYKLFQQQQFSFVRALEHTREEAHDLVRPVSSITQVQSAPCPPEQGQRGAAVHPGPLQARRNVFTEGGWTKALPRNVLCVTRDAGREAPVRGVPVLTAGISLLSSAFWFSSTPLGRSQKCRAQENNQTKPPSPATHGICNPSLVGSSMPGSSPWYWCCCIFL